MILRALAAGHHNSYTHAQGEGVSQIKQKEEPGIKRMNINVEIKLHNAFKAATAAEGVDMTTVLLEFIQSYVARSKSTPSKPKGRRA